jgi:hypothetical protein
MNTNECIVWLAEGYLKFKIKEEEEDNIAVNYTFSEFNFYTVKRK